MSQFDGSPTWVKEDDWGIIFYIGGGSLMKIIDIDNLHEDYYSIIIVTRRRRRRRRRRIVIPCVSPPSVDLLVHWSFG